MLHNLVCAAKLLDKNLLFVIKFLKLYFRVGRLCAHQINAVEEVAELSLSLDEANCIQVFKSYFVYCLTNWR